MKEGKRERRKMENRKWKMEKGEREMKIKE